MKLKIEQSDDCSDIEFIIKCKTIDSELSKLIEKIRLYGFALQGKKNDITSLISPEDIFYFESTDGRTYIYREKDVFECELKLYEIEERLGSVSFVRINKATILNLHKLNGFKTQMNGKLTALLVNGEKLEVNRHYVPEMKKRLAEMGGLK